MRGMTGITLVRIGYLTVGAACLLLGVGFALQMPWATALWLWPDTPLSYLFIGSILAAFGSGSLLVAWNRDWRAGTGGAVAMLIGFGGIAASLRFLTAEGGTRLPVQSAAFAAFAAVSALALIASLQFKPADNRPLTRLVRLSFLVFTAALALAAVALLLQFPRIFPWPLKPASSVAFGMMFAGLAVNYGYVAIKGTWSDVQVSLAGFLVYDLVLLVPFFRLFTNVSPDHLTSLIVYVSVLTYSALLAVYVLFVAEPDKTALASGS